MESIFSGGHQEYYSASSLFVASTGLFLVCFDSSSLKPDLVWKEFYSRVGTYLDLVDQTAAVAGIKPKIMLVATKVENPEEHQESIDKVLSLAKDQLTSRNSASFLVDGVLKTSSKDANKKAFEDMYGMVFCLCTSEELRSKPQEAIPTFWFRLLAALKEKSHTTVDKVIEMLEKIEAEQSGPSNIPREVLESLKKLREVVIFLTKINDSNNSNKGEESKAAQSQPTVQPSSESSKLTSEPTEVAIDLESGEASAPGDNNEPIGPESTARTEEDKQKREKIVTVIEYLKGLGELLFYPDNPDLSEIVITRPMDLVRSLRTVISHKAVDAFKKAEFQNQKLELLQKGLLSYGDFRTIYNREPDRAFTEEQVWKFLIQLGLGCSLQENKEEKLILVPSLINDSMETKFKKKRLKLERHEACVSIQYNFDQLGQNVGIFPRFLKIFTESMILGEKGGQIRMSYSQKIEKKTLGNVGGVLGVMKWHIKGITEPETFEFLLSEHESTLPSPDLDEDESNSECYAIHKGIRLSLKPIKGHIRKAMFEIFSKLDTMFMLNLEGVQRCLLCRECTFEGNYGSFPLTEGIQLQSTNGLCRPPLEHKIEKNLAEMMQRAQEPEPFKLESLMKMKKEDLGLEVFEESDIKKKMLNGDLAKGSQVWIYHDDVINPNLVARLNRYSHVVVYVGPRKDRNGERVLDRNGEEIHDVVHVAKSNWRGLVVAGISKVDIKSVIKANDMVFLGHKLKACQFAGNVREKIAERAIACAEKPKLLFAYDHR